jgi:hypothetical protein
MENEERETIISWTSADKVANVYTCHRNIQHRIERGLGIKPIRIEGRDGKEYEIPIKCVRFRKIQAKQILSVEQKKIIRDRFIKGKRHSKTLMNTREIKDKLPKDRIIPIEGVK